MIEPDDEARTFNWWVELVDNDGRGYIRRGNDIDYETGKANAIAQAKEMYAAAQSCTPIQEFLLYDDSTVPPTGVLANMTI